MHRALVFIIGLCVCARSSNGQPIPVPTPTETTAQGGSTSIPIAMPSGTEVMGAETAASSSAVAPVALDRPVDPLTYVCGPGDAFELNFWGQQNFRLRITADLEGRLFISKVGFVEVHNKTLADVRQLVNKRVRSNYPGLNFALTLLSPRTFVVHVAGNVQSPGTHTSTPLERVSVLLAKAGGIIGSRRRISIKHATGTKSTADLVLYELTGDTKYNPFLLDGDVVTVPYASVTVSIAGAVHRPGTYELIGSTDLQELLMLAGGLTSAATRTFPIRVIRRNKSERDSFLEVPFPPTGEPQHALVDDDRVVVRGSDELQQTILLIGAVVGADPLDNATTSKRLTYIEGDTAWSLINRAGGIKTSGDLKRSYISRMRNGRAELMPLDLEAIVVRREFTADRKVFVGDTIVVPPMQYSIRVEGAVGRPGLYPFNPLFGLSQYIAHAGGRTRTAKDLDDAILIDPSGKSTKYSSGLRPSPGDSILVPERSFTRAEVVQIGISLAGLLLSGVAITLAATR